MKWVIVSLFTYWAIKRVFRIINVVKNQDQTKIKTTPTNRQKMMMVSPILKKWNN